MKDSPWLKDDYACLNYVQIGLSFFSNLFNIILTCQILHIFVLVVLVEQQFHVG